MSEPIVTNRDEVASSAGSSGDSSSRQWRSLWRVHFYSGMFAMPFILLMAVTGLVILYTDPIQQATSTDETAPLTTPSTSKLQIGSFSETSLETNVPVNTTSAIATASTGSTAAHEQARAVDEPSVDTTGTAINTTASAANLREIRPIVVRRPTSQVGSRISRMP